jgi:hypothetical protein
MTRKQIIKKLDSVFSEYIRRRNAVDDIAECFTCGKKDHWKKLQCGHFQSRKHYSTRFDETNCQTQCAGCNVFRYGEQFVFGQNLNKKFGDGTAEKLLQKSREIVKFANIDLIEMIDRYKNMIQQLG